MITSFFRDLRYRTSYRQVVVLPHHQDEDFYQGCLTHSRRLFEGVSYPERKLGRDRGVTKKG
jgi:hypothetical protein